MNASLPHALDRTTATFDQLGVMWGRERYLNLSVHGLSHEQLHQLGGRGLTFRNGYETESEYVASVRVATPMGWEVSFFADADMTCGTCIRLLLPEEGFQEALQLAGIDGGGM